MSFASASVVPAASDIEAVRHFNRYYTRRIGVLGEALLDGGFSLAEARVLYEIAHHGGPERGPPAVGVARVLGLDPGYLSRLLRGLARRGVVARARSGSDARRQLVLLTPAGVRAVASLEARSREQVGALLAGLAPDARRELALAMQAIERLLEAGPHREPGPPFVLRDAHAGDFGWIVHRHGALYSSEYGWDASFEALVAEIVARLVRNFDPAAECCRIAERDGRIVGSATLVRESARLARLRLVYVEPEARGLGLGAALVADCERFAREHGYRKITLWTHANLTAARRIYARAGYLMTSSGATRSFGHDLVSETWEKSLVDAPATKPRAGRRSR